MTLYSLKPLDSLQPDTGGQDEFSSRYQVTPLTFPAQDPTVLVNGHALTISVPVNSESLAPGPKSHRVHVVDFDATANKYYAPNPRKRNYDVGRYKRVNNIERLVADWDFHAQNVYGHGAATTCAAACCLAWGGQRRSAIAMNAPMVFQQASI